MSRIARRQQYLLVPDARASNARAGSSPCNTSESGALDNRLVANQNPCPS